MIINVTAAVLGSAAAYLSLLATGGPSFRFPAPAACSTLQPPARSDTATSVLPFEQQVHLMAPQDSRPRLGRVYDVGHAKDPSILFRYRLGGPSVLLARHTRLWGFELSSDGSLGADLDVARGTPEALGPSSDPSSLSCHPSPAPLFQL